MSTPINEFRELPSDDSKTRVKNVFKMAEAVCALGTASHAEALSYLDEIGVSLSSSFRVTCKNYLNQAIEFGWITKVGETRATRYLPTRRFEHHIAMRHLAKPVHQRPIEEYDQKFLASYEPNQTFYLSAEQRRILHSACPIGTFNTAATNRDHQLRRFMADLSHHSAAFEGVNAKMADTIKLLEENVQSQEMSPRDAMVLRNHFKAIRFILDYCSFPPRSNAVSLAEYDVRQLHSMISDGLFADYRSQGRLRTSAVGVRDSSYMPLSNPDSIASTFASMLKKASAIADPYEQAVFLVIHIAYLQAFEDCNKRLARIICNVPLLNAGIKPLSWSNVNERDYVDSLLCVYEKRSVYGMCDVFTNACLRSFERFDQSHHETPDHLLSILWDKEIRAAVRHILLDGGDPQQIALNNVAADAREPVRKLIAAQLDALRENEMMAAGYGISRDDYLAWVAAPPTLT